MEFAQIAKWAIYGWKGAAHGNLSAEIPCFFMACRTRREQIPIVIQTARVDAAVRFCSQPNTVLASVLSVMKASSMNRLWKHTATQGMPNRVTRRNTLGALLSSARAYREREPWRIP